MRSAYLTCAACVLCAAILDAATERSVLHPRIRCVDNDAKDVFTSLVDQSPTFRRLVDEIDGSDLVVLVQTSETVPRYNAQTRLLTAAGGVRYVSVLIPSVGTPAELAVLLGHELQHVTEIAHAPDVRDKEGMRRLYQAIGWRSSGPDRFETRAAVMAGRQVLQELGVGFVVAHGLAPR